MSVVGKVHSEPQRLLVSAQRVAHLLSLSTSTVAKLDATMRLPAPAPLEGRLHWSVAELEAWVAAGCPRRDYWQIVMREPHGAHGGVAHPAEHHLQHRFLVRRAAAAAVVGISPREFANVNASGYAPRALFVGSARLWRTAELRLWIDRDYPAFRVWDLTQDGEWRAHPGLGGNRPSPPENDLRGEGPPWLFPKQMGGTYRRRSDEAADRAIKFLAERAKQRRG